jgi:hypothetical protein
MVVVMEPSATEVQIERVISYLTDRGMDVHRSTGVSRTSGLRMTMTSRRPAIRGRRGSRCQPCD